jgi:hypothetical protein
LDFDLDYMGACIYHGLGRIRTRARDRRTRPRIQVHTADHHNDLVAVLLAAVLPDLQLLTLLSLLSLLSLLLVHVVALRPCYLQVQGLQPPLLPVQLRQPV